MLIWIKSEGLGYGIWQIFAQKSYISSLQKKKQWGHNDFNYSRLSTFT